MTNLVARQPRQVVEFVTMNCHCTSLILPSSVLVPAQLDCVSINITLLSPPTITEIVSKWPEDAVMFHFVYGRKP